MNNIDKEKILKKWEESGLLDNIKPMDENSPLIPLFSATTKYELGECFTHQSNKYKMEIGELRLIPKGTKVWSIGLQMTVIFDEDVIVEVTNRIFGDENFFFGKMKMLLFNIPCHIPGLVDKANGDLGSVDIRKTLPYKIPEPMF